MAQARTKCMHDRNRAQLVHAIALTVHDKLRTLVQFFKKIVICFGSCKVLLLIYLSLTHTHKKDFKNLSQFTFVKPLSVSTLSNIPAVKLLKWSLRGKTQWLILQYIAILLLQLTRAAAWT